MESTIEQIERKIKEVDEAKVFFVMRRMHLQRVSEAQIRAVKIFIVLKEYGMTVVPSTTFSSFFGSQSAGSLAMLHQLGDKDVLVLVKNAHPGPLRYMLSDRFITLWNEPPSDINKV